MPERDRREHGRGDTDTYLIQRVQHALASDERVNELELEVWLAGGKLFVSGTVPTPERRAAVTELLEEIVTDRTVCNEVSVQPLDREPDVERLT